MIHGTLMERFGVREGLLMSAFHAKIADHPVQQRYATIGVRFLVQRFSEAER